MTFLESRAAVKEIREEKMLQKMEKIALLFEFTHPSLGVQSW